MACARACALREATLRILGVHSCAKKRPPAPVVGQAGISMGNPCYLRTETREPGVEALMAPSYMALQVTGGSMNSPA